MPTSKVTPKATPEENFLFAEASIGVEMEAFLASAIGRVLTARCAKAVDDFTTLCLDPNPPENALAVAKAKAYGAKMAMQFITEAVNNGRMSELQLRELEG